MTRTCIAAALVVLIAAAAGWPTRHGEFLAGDDQNLIVDHYLVNHPSWQNAGNLATSIHGDLYQPLPMLTLQANYALAQPRSAEKPSVSPFGFHLTNIVLHILNSLLAFLLAKRVAGCTRIGALTGILFACHPFALEAVAWISGRMVLLSTSFVLLTMLICLGRRPDGRCGWKVGALLAYACSILSKTVPTAPLAAVACDWHTNGRPPRRAWTVYIILLALAGGATWLSLRTGGAIPDDWASAEPLASAPIRMLLAGRYYLENYFWPTRLSPWSPPPKGGAEANSAALIALLEWAALAVFSLVVVRRRKTTLLGVILFVLLLAPFILTAPARRQLAADRYMYLPIFGLHLAISALAVKVLDSFRDRPARRSIQFGFVVIAAAVMVSYLRADRLLARCWHDTVSCDTRCVTVYPNDPDARAELARAHLFQKEPDAALRVIAEARKKWPDHPRLAAQAGEACRQLGDLPRADREFQAALEKMPEHLGTLYRSGLTREALGRPADAKKVFEHILELSPDYLPAITSLARIAQAEDDPDDAARRYERALAINPHHHASARALALIRIRDDRYLEAQNLLETILADNPDDLDARVTLGVAMAGSENDAAALALYEKILSGHSACMPARLNRAALLGKLGRTDDAEREYRELMRANPKNMDAAAGLHELFQKSRRFGEMLQIWQERVEADPMNLELRAWLAWSFAVADRMPDAIQVGRAIPEDSDPGVFVAWAIVFDALRRGEDSRILPMELMLRWTRFSAQSTAKRRSIVAALAELPEQARARPAALYALGCALMIDGNRPLARNAVEQIIAMKDPGPWMEPAQKLLARVLPTSQSAD